MHKCASPDAPQTEAEGDGGDSLGHGGEGAPAISSQGPHGNGHCLGLPDGRTSVTSQTFFFFSFRACSQLGDDPSDPEDFSGFGGKARGFPSPGTLQDLERWNADSF